MVVLGWLGATAGLFAQQPPVHYLHHGVMPPGAIGSQQLQRGGPLPGFYQPVEIKAPRGALISLAVANQFDEAQPAPRKAGMLIGAVYRLRVTNIRLAEGLEVFPTVEVIDRLYTPPDQAGRFAIPIELTENDLKLALDGKFVTRVIYLENPRDALPVRDNLQGQAWFEAAPGQDPLAVADALGRPVAILRLGARLPDQAETPDPSFFYGSPPFVPYPPQQAAPRQAPPQVRPAPPQVKILPPPEIVPAPEGPKP
jgi:hypothetical protein